MTKHHRVTENYALRRPSWSQARGWARHHLLVPDELGGQGEPDWSRCAIDSVSVHAVKGSS